MKKIVVFSVFCLFILNISAQEDLERRAFQVSFTYPLGTSGVNSYKYEYEASLNALIGITGGVDGMEAAGLININRYNVRGAQFAGLGNVTGGSVNAAQFSGLFNVVGGSMDGIQGSGLFNITSGKINKIQLAGLLNYGRGMTGFQGAGLINISSDSTSGFQGAGIVSVAAKSEDLVQVSGIGSFAPEIDGVQASGIVNIADTVRGVQVGGIINVSRYVEGVQVAGIINICDSIDGIPVALISIVRKGGYRSFEISSNEMFYMNTSFRIGIDKLYTILSVGYRFSDTDYNWGYGAGIGTRINIDSKKYLNVEYHAYQITHNWRHNEYNMINTLRVNFAYQTAEHLTFFAGPTINVLTSDFAVSANQIAPSWAFNLGWRDHVKGWFGFNLGMRF